MTKRPVVTLTLTVLVLIGIAGGVLASLKHEPSFYRLSAIDAGPARQQGSKEFMSQAAKLLNRIIDGSQGKWSYSFTEEQINSYFQEDFVQLGDAAAVAKLGIHDPRVHLQNDTLRLAFRYGSGFWSTVVTYEARLWIVPTEVNTLAVELIQRKAGMLPIAAQSVLKDFKDLAANKNIDMNWYRHDGNPVAVLRFPSSRARPNAQLLRFGVVNGQLTIEGQSFEPGAELKSAKMIPAS